MKVLNGFIGVILALSFIMGVYCAGTTKTYDFKKHLESISTVAEEMPHLEDLGAIWTKDIIESGHLGAHPMGSSYAEINIKTWPKNGVFAAAHSEESGVYWYSFIRFGMEGGSTEAQEALAPITDVFDSIMEVSGRVFYTFVWLGDYVGGFFELLWKVVPFSGIVERSAN